MKHWSKTLDFWGANKGLVLNMFIQEYLTIQVKQNPTLRNIWGIAISFKLNLIISFWDFP